MALTASKLRENIYRILDEVLETGIPVEIERKGRILRILPVGEAVAKARLEQLREHPGFLTSDPEELVQLGWLGEPMP
jgi:hypothetical protein